MSRAERIEVHTSMDKQIEQLTPAERQAEIDLQVAEYMQRGGKITHHEMHESKAREGQLSLMQKRTIDRNRKTGKNNQHRVSLRSCDRVPASLT